MFFNSKQPYRIEVIFLILWMRKFKFRVAKYLSNITHLVIALGFKAGSVWFQVRTCNQYAILYWQTCIFMSAVTFMYLFTHSLIFYWSSLKLFHSILSLYIIASYYDFISESPKTLWWMELCIHLWHGNKQVQMSSCHLFLKTIEWFLIGPRHVWFDCFFLFLQHYLCYFYSTFHMY